MALAAWQIVAGIVSGLFATSNCYRVLRILWPSHFPSLETYR